MVGDGHRDCEPAVHQCYEHDPAATTAASFERCPDCPDRIGGAPRRPRLPPRMVAEHGVIPVLNGTGLADSRYPKFQTRPTPSEPPHRMRPVDVVNSSKWSSGPGPVDHRGSGGGQ